jgi:hypothetical protein
MPNPNTAHWLYEQAEVQRAHRHADGSGCRHDTHNDPTIKQPLTLTTMRIRIGGLLRFPDVCH